MSQPAASAKSDIETSTIRAISWRLIPFLVLAYFFSYLDRVNLGFAALTMNADLKFSPLVFAWGAGIFFIGYFIFEVPSQSCAGRFGASRWIARIVVTWGVISAAMAMVSGGDELPHSPLPARRCRSRLPRHHSLADLLVSGGYRGRFPPPSPIARSCITRDRRADFRPAARARRQPVGLRGWQWLFILGGFPRCCSASSPEVYLTNRPERRTGEAKERSMARSKAQADVLATVE